MIYWYGWKFFLCRNYQLNFFILVKSVRKTGTFEWGSRGRRFDSCHSDQCVTARDDFRIRSRAVVFYYELLSIFRLFYAGRCFLFFLVQEAKRSNRTYRLVVLLFFYALFSSEKENYLLSAVSVLCSSNSPGCISSSLQNASMFCHDTGLLSFVIVSVRK